MENIEELIYACWLDTICWLTSKAKYKLLKIAGSTKTVYDMTQEQVTTLVGVKAGERFLQQKRLEPEKLWENIVELGIQYTYCSARDFPRKLSHIPDPPFGIFYKGELPNPSIPAMAIIGARNCSEYGRYMAQQFASFFATYKINIISGMALGIDGVSQQAALKAGGQSYAVLGCGVDVIYPKENMFLYRQLIENGGILSEYPPKMEPRPALFPPRNRIISALSDVVLVVEASQKSGTLITVDMALEQGREVYAVPGRCMDKLSKGCNQLLRQGAGVAVEPEELLHDMQWEHLKDTLSVEKSFNQTICEKRILSTTAKEVYQILDILPTTQNTIIERLRKQGSVCNVSQIYSSLVELELKGFVVCRNGQYSLSGTTLSDSSQQ